MFVLESTTGYRRIDGLENGGSGENRAFPREFTFMIQSHEQRIIFIEDF